MPKRSRELSGSDENSSNVRMPTSSNASTPITPTTPQIYSVASPPDIASLAPDPTELPGSTDLSSAYDVIYRVSQAHRIHCTYTEEIVTTLVRKPILLPNDSVLDEKCEVK